MVNQEGVRVRTESVTPAKRTEMVHAYYPDAAHPLWRSDDSRRAEGRRPSWSVPALPVEMVARRIEEIRREKGRNGGGSYAAVARALLMHPMAFPRLNDMEEFEKELECQLEVAVHGGTFSLEEIERRTVAQRPEGYEKSAVNKIVKGLRNGEWLGGLRLSQTLLLADALGCTIEYLQGFTEEPGETARTVTADQARALYDALGDDGREAVTAMLLTLAVPCGGGSGHKC